MEALTVALGRVGKPSQESSPCGGAATAARANAGASGGGANGGGERGCHSPREELTGTVPSPADLAGSLMDDHRALAQGRYRFLAKLREFDLHRACRGLGYGSKAIDTAEWMQVNCGVPREQTQEALGVAYRLLNLPVIETAFETGELSYEKVKLIAQVATLAEEATLLAIARVMTDIQLAEYCDRMGRDQRARRRRQA